MGETTLYIKVVLPVSMELNLPIMWPENPNTKLEVAIDSRLSPAKVRKNIDGLLTSNK